MTPRLNTLDHLVLTVADINRAAAFYTAVLGMERVEFHPADGSTRTALRYGNQKINLHRAGKEFVPNAAHATVGSADLCFLSETPLETWQEHLASWGIVVEDGPVPRNGATGPILSIYLRDPDGNLIEIANPA